MPSIRDTDTSTELLLQHQSSVHLGHMELGLLHQFFRVAFLFRAETIESLNPILCISILGQSSCQI